MGVVTGAGSGIGRALSVALVARGLRVLGVGRRREALEQTTGIAASKVTAGLPAMRPVPVDIATEVGRSSVVAAVDDVLAEEGATLAFLVHNAATLGEVGPVSCVTSEGFRGAMATNVEAPLFLTQLLASRLSATPGGGRVLHISSGAAHRPIQGWLSYCTSKAALLQLMRCLDEELAPFGVRVASAMPGIVDTEMQEALRNMDFPSVDMFRSFKERMPASAWSCAGSPPPGALDKPENVSDFFTWLLLDVEADAFGGKEWDINAAEDKRRWLGFRQGDRAVR